MRPRDAVTGATVLLMVGLVACSDDGDVSLDARADAGVDLFVDWGPDPDLPPLPEAAPDLPLPPDAGVDALEAGPDGPLPPPHGTCAAPQQLSLVSGVATVAGDTGISVDEHPTVSCGHPAGPWPGPQLYYKVALVGNKTYRATLTVTGWDPALYAFSAATPCGATEIDQACTGMASDSVGGDAAEVVAVSPAADEEWIFVVDSFGKSEHGPFTLLIEEITPPPNASCAAPEPVPLVGGSATVVGSTAPATDEGGISCGTGFTFDGPQLYYKLTPSTGTAYKATLTSAGWDATLYAFSPALGCALPGIDTGCKGNVSENAGVGGVETVVLQPDKATEWILAVDSWSNTAAGAFTLQIDETTIPANGTCAGAQSVSLAAGKVSISGDTTLAPDDFGASITCGISGGWYAGGHQLYYEVGLGAGKALKITLSPTFPASLYLFSDSAGCQAQAIEADCASGGVTGDVVHLVSAGTTQSFAFAPAAAGSYLLAVDTMSAQFGPFTLDLEEVALPGNTSCAAPQTLTLVNGQASAIGDTALSADELGGAVSCGGGLALEGPQLYHKVSLVGGKSYTITASPQDFDAALYAFPAATTCDAAAVEAACTGHLADVGGTGTAETLALQVATSADWILVVDAYSALHSGAYSLKVEQAP